MNKLFTSSLRATFSIIIVMALMALTFTIVGCGEGQANYTPTHQWYQEGPLEYRFPNAYTCIIRTDGGTITIPRHLEEGESGPIEWEWEDDGDIDIKFAGRDYDLDSPFDYDDGEEFEGYEDIGGGFVMVWLGGKLVKKPKTWLKANPKYNKTYSRTKYKRNPDGSVTKTKVVTTKGTNGVATAKVSKTTVSKTGAVTKTTRTTVAKAPVKKTYKSKKRRK